MRKAVMGAMVAASLAAAAPATGATYCVPAHAGCTGLDRTTLGSAVNDADATPAADDIYLAAGTFTGGVTVGSWPVHIHGAGQDVTRIEGGGGPGGYGVYMAQTSSSIEDLTIHELAGGHGVALYLGGAATRVTVDQRDNAVASSIAVSLQGDGSFVDGAALAALAPVPVTNGISATANGPMLISNVRVQGGDAVGLYGSGPITTRFAKVLGKGNGIVNESDNALIEDSVVSGAPVVGRIFGGTGDIVTTLRHVTLNGTYVGADSNNFTSKVVVSNSAVVGGGLDPETPDIDLRQQSSGTARVEADYSFFRASHVVFTPGPGIEYVPGTHNIDGADAKLVNLAGGDLRLRFDSPLVDTGDPVPGGGEPQADIAGEFRAVNGRTDIGAYEYGRHAPGVSAVADPMSSIAGKPILFTAGPTDVDPGEVPTVTWAFDDGTTVAGERVSHAFATPGAHLVTATATDPAGVTARAMVTVTIAVPPRVLKPMAPAFGFGKLVARKGIVRLLLSCPSTATDCTGKVELRLAAKPKAKAKAARVVILGKARYAIVRGARKTINVRLSNSARRRLGRATRGLRVEVVLKPVGAKTASKTVRLKRR